MRTKNTNELSLDMPVLIMFHYHNQMSKIVKINKSTFVTKSAVTGNLWTFYKPIRAGICEEYSKYKTAEAQIL